MRDLKELQAFWRAHPADDLMLCTIVGKTGSGYRGLAAHKIIARDSTACGYLSGGCLEGDIVAHALDRWDDAPFRREFSTMSEEDRLLGYQTGCAGLIDILFERLPRDLDAMPSYLPFGPAEGIAAIAIALAADRLGQRTRLAAGASSDGEVFVEAWTEPFRLTVIGCGPNAGPLADLALPLGWDVAFLDYRQGNIAAERPGLTSAILPLARLGAAVPQGKRSAVVITTHNYEADMTVLGQLNGREFHYLGCLGPRARFEQMQRDLKKLHAIAIDPAWAAKLHAPAGLRHARTPEDIAFSIVAEIQFSLDPGTGV